MRSRFFLALATAALLAVGVGPAAYANLGPYSAGPNSIIPVDFGPQQVGTTATLSIDLNIDAGYVYAGSYISGSWTVDGAFVVHSAIGFNQGTCFPGPFEEAAGPTVCTVNVSFTPPGTHTYGLELIVVECPEAGGSCPGWTIRVTGHGVVDTVSPFSQPVDNLPTINTAKAGSSIPLKFSVTDPTGAPITNLTAADVAVTSAQGGDGCGTDAGTDAIETYVGGAGLQNLGGGAYQYNWATPKSYKGQCRTVTVEIGGDSQSAGFQFK